MKCFNPPKQPQLKASIARQAHQSCVEFTVAGFTVNVLSVRGWGFGGGVKGLERGIWVKGPESRVLGLCLGLGFRV